MSFTRPNPNSRDSLVNEADKEFIENYLHGLRAAGQSSPAGKYWDRTFREIVEGFPKEKWPGNPLILGGSIASDANKHKQFREHLLWAARHGRLDKAMKALSRVPETGWNRKTSSLPSDKE